MLDVELYTVHEVDVHFYGDAVALRVYKIKQYVICVRRRGRGLKIVLI